MLENIAGDVQDRHLWTEKSVVFGQCEDHYSAVILGAAAVCDLPGARPAGKSIARVSLCALSRAFRMLHQETNNEFYRDACGAVSLMGLKIVESDDRARQALVEDWEYSVASGGANEIPDKQLISLLVKGIKDAMKYVDLEIPVFGDLSEENLAQFDSLYILADMA